MATLSDLYSYYCRRWDCRPNSAVLEYLDEEYARHDNQRILEEVDVSDNYLGKKGIIPVMDLVKNTKTVRRIDFSNNLLEHEQLEHLVYCLVLHPSIQSVILRNNCLHEGSLGHVIELLKRNPSIVELDLTGNDFLPASIVLLKELTMANREKTAKRVTEDEAIAKLRRDRELHPFQAEVNGSFTEENSGGYLHFATWWRNPQYRIAVSKTTRVCITMKIHDGIEARQSGFVVMRFDGIRRVVEVTKRTIIVESPVDCNRCVVETKLEEGAHYVIMPFTFHPGRTMQYTLGAKLIHDKVTLDEGWVTFDLLDERYDWCTNLVQREWEEKNSGGCGLHHTWRNNDMFRLRYTGPPIPYYNTSPATVCIILSKAIDSDLNDEKEIGLDVMEHDTYCQGKPPMLCTPDVVRTSRRHERVTSIFLKFSSHTSDLDLFLVPSTKEPNQHGRYSLAIFSTVPTEVETSHFPHRWNYRVLNGVWDDTCCGGCRELYKSWKNNPAVELVMEEGDGRTPITACLEMDQESYAQSHQQRLADDQAKACSVEEAFLDPEEAKVAEGNRAFTVKHRASLLEGCISVVDGAPPRYIERRTSALSSTEAQMTIIDTSAPFYFVPMARHAGQQGSYRLHLFCADPFVVASVETLALRERRAQLAQYEVENQARKTQQRGAASATTEASNGLQALHDLHVARNDILRSNLSSGAQFVDREFPRGTSSLWLAPEGRAPSYFPAEYTWVRAKEMGGPSTGCLRNGVLSPPFPYGRRHWLASVIQAVATKPHWLARLLVVYDEEAGFAQFRFFKTDAWVGVTIDDYLTRDAAGELCFGHSMDKQDYFYPLLEKAYAKLHRCYQALELPVTPELSLLDVLCQGMMDCSGGYAYVIPIRTEDAEEMEAEAKEAFWRTLKGATRSDLLFSLILRSDLPGASERQHVGLLSDHLYGVLDARFIEQQRLVKVRNWVDGQDATWKGQWAPHSDNWTPTLLEVLEYNHEQNEVWMSLDELLYYFSDVIVTEQHKHISLEMGDFPNTLQDPEECDERLRNPQYQLTIRDLPKDNSPVEIVIGLHQRDARLSVIRDKNAVAHYKVGLGLAVFGTADNMRRLKSVGDDEVAKLIAPQKRRDIFTLLTVDPTKLNATHYTIMPFRESLRERNTMYYVTARSAHATVEVTPVDHNTTITLDGAWEELTAGGPPELPTWRNNRQFFLYPSEIMEVAVRLMPTFNPSRAAPLSVGFSIHSTKRCNSFLFYEPDTVMLHVGPEAKPSVSGTVTLLGMKERRGMPYVIVPYVNEANSLSTYTLEVVANRKFTLLPIEPRLDWHRSIHNVHITTEDGSAGGSLGYPSWRCNPQFALTFPATREGRLFITAVNRATGDKHNPLGMALLRGDLSWDGGRRRKVTYEEADVIATTSDCLGRVDLDVELSLADTEAPVILVVYTTKPYREVDVEVSVYSAPEVEIAPVAEWKCVAIAENSWELGQTAGGSRSDFASWINNPFLALSTIRPTQIVALLIQYPRGPEKPIVKRYQNKKTFLPPPITNPNSRMAIELDLVNYDRELTSILHAGSSMDAEITLTASLEACTDHPFLMVPCTTIPEKNGDFKLIVYADHPIDLYGVEKPRLWYV